MGDPLADALRNELPCEPSVAALLASLAREGRVRLGGGAEDSDEDLLVRLRDPRAFGELAELALEDPRFGRVAREAVLEHVFDLLPLPRSEGDVIEVATRAPPRLLGLAVSLAEFDALSVLHVMHLVYAIFLDRALLANVSRQTRSTLYWEVLGQGDAGEDLRVLYACLHLATVAEREAATELRRTLRSSEIPAALRQSLASIAASEDGGHAALTKITQRVGLLPSELRDAQAPAIVANVPRLPGKLVSIGRRHLDRRQSA